MAEDSPSDHSDRFMSRAMVFGAKCLLRAPWFVVGISALLAVAGAYLAATQLGFRTSRNDLLNPNDTYNKRWQALRAEFGDNEDAVVVVEGSDRNQVLPVLDEVAQRLASNPRYFEAVLHRVELSPVFRKGLHFLSLAELSQIEGQLAEVAPILAGDWSFLNLGRQVAMLNRAASMPGQASGPSSEMVAAMKARIPKLIDNLHAAMLDRPALNTPPSALAESFAKLPVQETRYLLAKDGKIGFVVMHLAKESGEFAPYSASIDEARRILAEVKQRHSEVTIGLTGLPVMENDEMRISQDDMNLSNVVSLVLVGLLFWAGFGGVRHALLGVVVLLIGMAWSLGFATLAIGHLNILSVAFGVVLIGLGIDYPIHFVSRYLECRAEGSEPHTALVSTTKLVGPGLITGGLTTAGAFLATALTSFRGVAELGIISGCGILFCIAATLIVLPPLIYIFDMRPKAKLRVDTLQLAKPLHLLFLRPGWTTIAIVVITLFAGLGLRHLSYDHNLLRIQPKGVESVALESRLLGESDQNAWYAISVANTPAEALRRKALFQKLPAVDHVEEIASLLPETSPEKQAAILQLGRNLNALPDRPPVIPCESPAMLETELAQMQVFLLSGDETLRALQRPLAEIREALRTLSAEQSFQKLAAYQQRLAGELLAHLTHLRSVASPTPPELSDLPPCVVNRFVSPRGKHLLRVYAKGDIWQREQLTQFIREVQSLDPDITGHPLQAYYASSQMQQSYLHAAIYATLVMAIIVVIDFKNLFHSLLSMIPLAAGMLQMFGLMGWLNIPLNPANLIALPLIVGVGIDGGVHIVHDFLQQRNRYRLGNSTLNSVMLSALTTTGSFGALLLARHQGLRTLGQVLTIGVTTCFLSCVLLLPALLIWRQQWQASRSRPEESEPNEEGLDEENESDFSPDDFRSQPRIDAPTSKLPPAHASRPMGVAR